MALFILNQNITICVRATRIAHEKDYVAAYNDRECVAIFKASEIICCWLDEIVNSVH